MKAKGYDVVVSNAGVWGDTTQGVLQRLDKAIPAGTQIVILKVGTNDYSGSVSASTIDADVDQAVARLRAKQAEVIVFRWRDPPAKFVDEGGSVPLVERFPDRILVPRYPRGIPANLMADGGHLMGAANAMIVARTVPVVEEVRLQRSSKGVEFG